MPDAPAIVEWVKTLSERHGGSALAKSIGVSPTAVSLVKKGERPPSETFTRRLLAIYPLPEPEPQAPRRGSSELKTNPEVVWLNRAIATVTDLVRLVEEQAGELDEVDRLVCHPQYQAMRTLVLSAHLHPEFESVLLGPPTSGPAVEIARALGTMRALLPESVERQKTIDPEVSSELYRRHSQFRRMIDRHLRKLAQGGDPGALVKCGAWRATLTSVCALLKPVPDDRVRVIGALEGGDNAFCESLARALEGVRSISFPCVEFADDPVGFFRTILGLDVWAGQIRIIEGVLRHKWVVVHTGHKIGKTKCLAGIALWRYCCFVRGRVIITNSTGDQLETQDWMEIRETWAESGICLDCKRSGVTARPCPHSQCIDGEPAKSSKGGLESPDGKRWIYGSTAKRSDYAGGYSGSELAIIVDEFSSMPQELYEAWIGNTAADGTIFIGVGNPIGFTGPMHDAVNVPRIRKNFHVINVSTEETIGVNIPGLGGQRYVDFVRDQDERGEESPFYQVRVKGRYPKLDTAAIFPLGRIIEAQDLDNYKNTVARGPLVITIDPAGEKGLGDEAGIGVFRGQKWLEKKFGRGWSYDYYLDLVIEYIERNREHRNEKAIIAIDADGEGQKVMTRLDNYLLTKRLYEHEKVRFDVVPVYTGQNAPDEFRYDLVRDEAFGHASRWLNNGGVFEADPKLEQELQISKWFAVWRNRQPRGRVELMSATRKDGPEGFRAMIHRSPTRLDLLLLFAYVSFRQNILDVPSEDSEAAQQDQESQVERIDPRNAMRDYMRQIKKGRHM